MMARLLVPNHLIARYFCRNGGPSISEEDAQRQGCRAPVSGQGWLRRWGCPPRGHTKEGAVVSGGGSPSEKDEDLGLEDAFGLGCWHERRPGVVLGHSPRRVLGEREGEGVGRVVR